jgi:hypothetical protein
MFWVANSGVIMNLGNSATVATVATDLGLSTVALNKFLVYTNPANWTYNGGGPTVTNNVVLLTDGAGGEARSGFYNVPLYVGAFQASFTYQDVGGGGADGVAFVLQNAPAGPFALGGGGGAFGYGGGAPITPSAALEFNIYSAYGVGLAFATDGITGGPYFSTDPVNIAGGDPIQVAMCYVQGTLQLTLTDADTLDTFSTNLDTGDLTSVLGGNTAWVGLAGATGGSTSTQQITDFLFVSLPSLSIQLTSTNAVVLSWAAAATGFSLQQNGDLTVPNWQAVAAPVNVVGEQNQVVVSLAVGSVFYRLAHE